MIRVLLENKNEIVNDVGGESVFAFVSGSALPIFRRLNDFVSSLQLRRQRCSEALYLGLELLLVAYATERAELQALLVQAVEFRDCLYRNANG